MLVVISGLPAVGKTALAEALSRRIEATHLSVDWAEDALLRVGLEPGWTTGVAAYAVVAAAAQQNLVIGRIVVVDAVNDSEPARQVWRDAAAGAAVQVLFVLLLPPTRTEHQRRLRVRQRGLGYVPEPSWSQVVVRAESYEPWPNEPIELSSSESVESLVDRLQPEIHRRE